MQLFDSVNMSLKPPAELSVWAEGNVIYTDGATPNEAAA
jgi:hypothetical protein